MINYLNVNADNLYYDKKTPLPKQPENSMDDPFWQEEARKMNERKARRNNGA